MFQLQFTVMGLNPASGMDVLPHDNKGFCLEPANHEGKTFTAEKEI